MKKSFENSKRYLNIRVCLKILCLILIFFGVNIYLNFATDTYATFYNGFKVASSDMLFRNGRPVIALIYYLFYLSGLPNEIFYYGSAMGALILLGISLLVIQKMLSDYIPNENLRIVISFISVANIYIIEYFMFVEKCGFMLAIMFNCLAIYYMESFFRTHYIKYFILAILMVLLATFTYQGTVALFVILSLPFVYKYAENVKEYIINLFYICVAYGCPILICMVCMTFIFNSTRLKNTGNIVEILIRVIETCIGVIRNLIYTFNVLTIGLYALLLAAIIIVSLTLVFKEQNEKMGGIL